MRPHSLTFALVGVLLASPALAERVDPNLFTPGFGAHALLGLEPTTVSAHGTWHLGLVYSAANDEVVASDSEGVRKVPGLLSDRTILSLGVGVALWERIEFGLALPYILASSTGVEASTHSIGDLRISVKGRLLGAARGFALGAQVQVTVPTATELSGEASPLSNQALFYDGHGGLSLWGRLIADWRSAKGSLVTASVGYFHRPARPILSLDMGDELRAGLGLELTAAELGAPIPLSLLAEAEMLVGLGADTSSNGVNPATYNYPIEVRSGLRWRAPMWMLSVGMGVGLTEGYGNPDYRVIARLDVGSFMGASKVDGAATEAGVQTADWEPQFNPIPVLGAPTSSNVGSSDAPSSDSEASAEQHTQALARLTEALAQDPDPDGDGILADADKCPMVAEDKDGFQDEDGCPDLDNDSDGIPDVSDACPLEPETLNGIKDEDGCPDEGESRVVARAGEIELRDSVEFETNSDVLKPSSLPLLQQVASVLKANPQVKLVRVEGHTDNAGNAEMNVDLSERRAGRVVKTLIEFGVEGSRLRQRGFGPTRPVAPNTTREGRQKNRRVDFRIVDPAPPGQPRIEVDDIGEEKPQ